MKKLMGLALIIGMMSSPAVAGDGCAYRLLSWIGFNGTGYGVISAAEPGDVLLSVTSTSGDGVEYITNFVREIVPIPSVLPSVPIQLFVGVQQTSSANLSSKTFIGLVCRKEPGSK